MIIIIIIIIIKAIAAECVAPRGPKVVCISESVLPTYFDKLLL